MKNKIKVLFLFLFLITGCDKKEYALIEITAEQLTNCLVDENCSITYAFYNQELGNSEEFMENLKKISKETKENIYFVDSNHINMAQALLLYDGLGVDYTLSNYGVYQNGKEVLYGSYENYTSLKSDLNGKKYDTELIQITQKEIEENLKKAREYYEKGYISKALSYLNVIWSTKEAKEEYETELYYKMINEWEVYTMLNNKDAEYKGIIFDTMENAIYIGKSMGELTTLEKPSFADYEKYYYYVKDDILYIAEKEDGSYKEAYKILKIAKDQLLLSDNEKQYNLYPM